MWEPSEWKTEDDILTDILLLSEYSLPINGPVPPVPDTITKYRKQMAENRRKPLNSDIDESLTYIVSGRGKGIRDRAIRPGGIVDSHPSDEAELRKQIRQVVGYGYANEIIEKSIMAKAAPYDPAKFSDADSGFKLVVTSGGNNSSKSSNEDSPTKKTENVRLNKKTSNQNSSKFS